MDVRFYYEDLNTGERGLVDWQGVGRPMGGFAKALWEAIENADGTNLMKLAKAFPEEVEALIRFRNEDGYWPRILAGVRGEEVA